LLTKIKINKLELSLKELEINIEEIKKAKDQLEKQNQPKLKEILDKFKNKTISIEEFKFES
jgi:DNA-binding transcriptional MerR regulator